MSRNPRILGALALTVACCATIGLTAGTAQAEIYDKIGNINEHWHYTDSDGRTGDYQFSADKWDNGYQRYQRSTVYVSGQDKGAVRVNCLRGNGGGQWYESTIYSRNGLNPSHYDCSGNGTYNRGYLQVALQLYKA
ncbi:hypothetical protein [Embleya scabrispora]|uniref:hypothetical protein n=1 Tax=Embleya scabrispora TaxID=159449 RepID=UPI00036D28C4|nr:hypothetical protein [Embleya scabrispora]MYS85155.1 hypothetical protein [Streptomyces sp. SID5474]